MKQGLTSYQKQLESLKKQMKQNLNPQKTQTFHSDFQYFCIKFHRIITSLLNTLTHLLSDKFYEIYDNINNILQQSFRKNRRQVFRQMVFTNDYQNQQDYENYNYLQIDQIQQYINCRTFPSFQENSQRQDLPYFIIHREEKQKNIKQVLCQYKYIKFNQNQNYQSTIKKVKKCHMAVGDQNIIFISKEQQSQTFENQFNDCFNKNNGLKQIYEKNLDQDKQNIRFSQNIVQKDNPKFRKRQSSYLRKIPTISSVENQKIKKNKKSMQLNRKSISKQLLIAQIQSLKNSKEQNNLQNDNQINSIKQIPHDQQQIKTVSEIYIEDKIQQSKKNLFINQQQIFKKSKKSKKSNKIELTPILKPTTSSILKQSLTNTNTSKLTKNKSKISSGNIYKFKDNTQLKQRNSFGITSDNIKSIEKQVEFNNGLASVPALSKRFLNHDQ